MSQCKCSMSISVLGDGCRYCQPQEYIDRIHDQMEDDRAMVVPDIARFEKHAMKARECLSECDVVLLSSIRRLLAAPPAQGDSQ